MKTFRLHIILVLASGLLFSTVALSAESPANLDEAQQQMDEILTGLSRNINLFESLRDRLADLGQANANYDEQKNLWLSSFLTLSAISVICEYENDLLTLFMELRDKNRRHFYEVRMLSLETSIQQISIMNRQIEINHRLITHEAQEQKLIDTEKKLILSSSDLLQKSLALIKSLQP
jgi:hypothetical protein